MANLAPVFKQKFDDDNGNPLVGGKLYSYAAGTSTPKGTFKDRDASVANTNPIILNARGECDVWIYGSYKFVLKDANDVDIWTVDKVSGEAKVIMSVADITARDAIPAALRYEGMLVYVVSEKKTYQLQGGITNSNWSAFFGSTPVIDTFTGNAILTAFTLSVDPGFKENVMAFIDGVRQELSQYSVSGSTLTFTFAPYDGSSIQTIVATVNVVNVPANTSVTTPKIANLAVTTAKIADAAVTNAKLAPVNFVLSSNITFSSTVNALNVSIALAPAITTVGRPVEVGLDSNNAGFGNVLLSGWTAGASVEFRLFKNSTQIKNMEFFPSTGTTGAEFPCSIIKFTDWTASAGSNTYELLMFLTKTTGTPTVAVGGCRLYVKEL